MRWLQMAVRRGGRTQAGKTRTALLWIVLIAGIVATATFVVINWIEQWLNIDIGW